jgi:hypothetical protein
LLAGLDVGGHRLGDDQRAAALVVDPGDRVGHLDPTGDRQRGVQLEGLLGVHQLGRVEVAQRAPPGARLRGQHRERGQHLELHAGGVLGGELELLQRVLGARAEP